MRKNGLFPIYQYWYNEARQFNEKEVRMWELRFFLQGDLIERMKFDKPQHAREKIEATYQAGLLEIDKEGITIFYPVRMIQKIEMKRL